MHKYSWQKGQDGVMTSKVAVDGDDYTWERRSGVAVFNQTEATQYDLPAVETHTVPEKGWTVTTVITTPAQGFAALRGQFSAAADAITNPNERYNTPAGLDPGDLRTVPMPDLRTADQRGWDDVAELREEIQRLRDLVALTTAPLDVALRVDNLVDAVELLTSRVRALEAGR